MRKVPVYPARGQPLVAPTQFQAPLGARRIPQFPVDTLAVNPGGPRAYDGLSPPNIPDPKQRGIVTRYGLIDNVEITNLVSNAFQDPKVIAYQTQYAITAADWTALATAIENSMTAPPQSQIFPFETQVSGHENPDVAAFAGTMA